MTETKTYEADTPTQRQAVVRKLIMGIEDLVEEALPNDLYNQNYLFTLLYNNIQARVLHERHYEHRLKRPERELGTNEIQ